MASPHLSIVVPAYNEEARIGPSLERMVAFFAAQTYSWDLLVVSDGSQDGTNAMVEGFAKEHAETRLLSYQPNRGKGYAVRRGMLLAEGELVLFMDADLATPVEETDKLLARMADGADVAIGSRPIRGSRLERHQPFLREALGRLSNKVVQLLAVRGIQDTQCGFKMFTRNAAQDVFKRCRLNGFSFDFEALVVARDLGLRIDETPIRWAHQEGSKVVFWRDYPKALRDLVTLRLRGKRSRLTIRER